MTARPVAEAAVQKYNKTMVRLFKNWTGYRRFDVKKPKYDCKQKQIRAMPKKTQSMMMVAEFHAHDDPAKVKATMNRTKVAAFKTAPNQSIDANFAPRVIVGFGLYPGNRMI